MPNEEPQRLRQYFENRNCYGIAQLITYLSEDDADRGRCIQIGSSSWIDNDRVLDKITLLMRQYGFPHLPTYLVTCLCGEHSEWHKHLYIGERAAPDGVWVMPLDWLTLFSRHIDAISPQALDLFDRGCGGFAATANAPSSPRDISYL